MLALLCGQGRLPGILAETRARGDEGRPLVCGLEGFLPDDLEPDLTFRLETLGTLLQDLKTRGVTEVCFAGAMRRPPVDPSRIDAATWPLVPVLQKAIMAGDDGALRAVVGIFEDAGLSVIGAHQVAPAILPPPGVPTRAQPGESDRRDARRGADVLARLSALDLGQACAVLAGQVLAVEAIFGTDWMLRSLTARADSGSGGLLCKSPKMGQDRRIDLPAIGPETVQGVRDAGLRGIVLEAGGVIVLELAAVIEACDAAGLFLWIRDPDEA